MIKRLKVNLNPYQKIMYDGLEKYIVNTGRCQGKTYVACVCFVERGYKELGTWQKVFDHYPLYAGNIKHVFGTIVYLFDKIENNDGYSIDFNENEKKIRIRYATDAEIKARKDAH